MKLIISIVQDRDVSDLVNELIKDGFSVTKLASTGGFLRSGNTTLLLGVKEDDVDKAIAKIKEICKKRNKRKNVRYPVVQSTDIDVPYSAGINIQVGGAIIFVIDLEQFTKI